MGSSTFSCKLHVSFSHRSRQFGVSGVVGGFPLCGFCSGQQVGSSHPLYLPGRILRHHGGAHHERSQCNAARRRARAKRAGARSAQLLPLLCAASLRHEGFACSRTPRPPAPAHRRDAPGSRSSVTCRCRRYSRGSSLSLSLTLALTLTCSRSEPRRRTLTLTLSLSLTLTDMPLRTHPHPNASAARSGRHGRSSRSTRRRRRSQRCEM